MEGPEGTAHPAVRRRRPRPGARVRRRLHPRPGGGRPAVANGRGFFVGACGPQRWRRTEASSSVDTAGAVTQVRGRRPVIIGDRLPTSRHIPRRLRERAPAVAAHPPSRRPDDLRARQPGRETIRWCRRAPPPPRWLGDLVAVAADSAVILADPTGQREPQVVEVAVVRRAVMFSPSGPSPLRCGRTRTPAGRSTATTHASVTTSTSRRPAATCEATSTDCGCWCGPEGEIPCGSSTSPPAASWRQLPPAGMPTCR